MLTLTHDDLIQQILTLPNAPTIFKELGDKLEEERERRLHFYNEITEYEKAEFINGEIVIHSPVKKGHNDVTALLSRLISMYVDKHDLGYVGIEKVMITLTRNDYEPDICFFKQEKAKHFKSEQSLFPAPDLVVEVLSKRTAKNDRTIKFKDYESHGVLEYWIIDPKKQVLEQYRLNKKHTYELITKSSNGTVESEAIANFQIPIQAIFDKKENMKTVVNLLSK